jgi:hypothetical protein
MWTALILSFYLASTKEYVSQGVRGAETHIQESLGPVGMTKAECEAFINDPKHDQRKRVAAAMELKDHRQLKYECAKMPLSDK